MITITSLFWLIAAMLFLLLEIGHPGLFFFLSFFFACLAGAFGSFYGLSLPQQALLVVGGCVVSFFILQKIAKSIGHHKPRTNIYALEGQMALVIADITADNPGRVKINGEQWMAKTNNGQTLLKDTKVHVVGVKGAHVIVKKIDE